MQDPLVEARSHILRYWYVDGLSEIATGLLQLLVGGWLFLASPTHGSSVWYQAATLMYVLLFFAYALLHQRMLQRVRERITYPRVGYVSLPEASKTRRVSFAVTAAMLPFVVGALAFYVGSRSTTLSPDRWLQWMPAALGMGFGSVLLFVGARIGLLRFLLLGAMSVVLGPSLSLLSPSRPATARYFVSIGCALLLSGSVTLWRYVHSTSPISGQA